MILNKLQHSTVFQARLVLWVVKRPSKHSNFSVSQPLSEEYNPPVTFLLRDFRSHTCFHKTHICNQYDCSFCNKSKHRDGLSWKALQESVFHRECRKLWRKSQARIFDQNWKINVFGCEIFLRYDGSFQQRGCLLITSNNNQLWFPVEEFVSFCWLCPKNLSFQAFFWVDGTVFFEYGVCFFLRVCR